MSTARERILAHKQQREDAEALIELAGERPETFWRVLQEAVQSRLPQVIQPSAMTREEAERFERVAIPFGQHVGTEIGEVPVGYLLWLTEQPDQFRFDLLRYVRSSVFAERQDA